MHKQFAVFDIDGTIARTSLLQLMVRELITRGKVGLGPGREIEVMLHDFRQRIADDDFGGYMKKAVDMLFAGMPNGLRVDEYHEIINAVVNTSLTNTYVYTRELVQTLRQNNFFLIAISGSEVQAVGKLASALGFDLWVGEVSYEHQDGKLTGVVNSLGKSKSEILQDIIYKYGLRNSGSLAVGDTSSDIGILEMVDTPIVFNPNQALYKVAEEKSWMVVIERKDMVYRLEKVDNQFVLKQTNT